MCLRDVEVELEPLTIFVGPNSSGKSALFKAFGTLSRLLRYPVRGAGRGEFSVDLGITLDDAVWNGDSSFPIKFEVWFEDPSKEQPDYTIELRRGFSGWGIAREKFWYVNRLLDTGEDRFEFETTEGVRSWPSKSWSGPYPYSAPLAYLTYPYARDPVASPHVAPIQDLRSRIGVARRYRPSASVIASFTRIPPTSRRTDPAQDVDEAGRGLALALRELVGGGASDRESFTRIEEGLQKLHDHIRSIGFKADWRGVGLTYRTTRSSLETSASLESDGVLLSTFLLWRVHTAPANFKLCLEEPENGVHLSLLPERYQLLKEFALPTEDHPNMQILVATHSRDFLNAIPSRNDILREVRVVEFDPDSGSSIHALNHYREIDQLLTEFKHKMGDLWWAKRLEHRLRQ